MTVEVLHAVATAGGGKVWRRFGRDDEAVFDPGVDPVPGTGGLGRAPLGLAELGR